VNKIFIISISLFLLFFTVVISIDTLSVRDDILTNEAVVSMLKTGQKEDRRKIRELKTRIEKIDSDSRTIESVLMKKFKMLRKDQFIINDKSI